MSRAKNHLGLRPEVHERYVVNVPGVRVVWPGLGEYDMRKITLAEVEKLAALPRTQKYFTLRRTPLKPKRQVKARGKQK
jgi:hypothetical protein